jgi:hypothetical protein
MMMDETGFWESPLKLKGDMRDGKAIKYPASLHWFDDNNKLEKAKEKYESYYKENGMTVKEFRQKKFDCVDG